MRTFFRKACFLLLGTGIFATASVPNLAHGRYDKTLKAKAVQLAVLPSGYSGDLGPYKMQTLQLSHVTLQAPADVAFYLDELKDLKQLCDLTKVSCVASVGEMLGADLILQSWSPQGQGDIFRIIDPARQREIHRQVVPSSATANEWRDAVSAAIGELLGAPPPAGQLRIEIPEGNSRLYVDGVNYGLVEKGVLVANLEIGTHRVMIDAPLGGLQDQEVRITAGQQTKLAFAEPHPIKPHPLGKATKHSWEQFAGWSAIGAGAVAAGVGSLFYFAHPVHQQTPGADAIGNVAHYTQVEKSRVNATAFVLLGAGIASAASGAAYLWAEGFTE